MLSATEPANMHGVQQTPAPTVLHLHLHLHVIQQQGSASAIPQPYPALELRAVAPAVDLDERESSAGSAASFSGSSPSTEEEEPTEGGVDTPVLPPYAMFNFCSTNAEYGFTGRSRENQSKRERETGPLLVEAEQKLKGLLERRSAAVAENRRLRCWNRDACARLEQAELRQCAPTAVHRTPRNPVLLPDSCSLVSFTELPPSSRWDAAWISRIAELHPQDVTVLRRQWTQASAVLLPHALRCGPGSRAYRGLQELYDKHVDLVRVLVMEAPGTWLESSHFDLDSLQPVKMPTAEWVRDMFMRQPSSKTPRAPLYFKTIAKQYADASSVLHDEYRTLLGCYNFLARTLGLQQQRALPEQGDDGGFGARGAHARALERLRRHRSHQRLEVLDKLDDTAGLLQVNTSKYKTVLLKLVDAFTHQFHPDRIRVLVSAYPLACIAVDYVPGMLLLGGAAPSATARPDQHPTPAPEVGIPSAPYE